MKWNEIAYRHAWEKIKSTIQKQCSAWRLYRNKSSNEYKNHRLKIIFKSSGQFCLQFTDFMVEIVTDRNNLYEINRSISQNRTIIPHQRKEPRKYYEQISSRVWMFQVVKCRLSAKCFVVKQLCAIQLQKCIF